jgi:hypothetical protein
MKAGTGKIARLPRDVRDELNRRLDDGEDGAALLDWLNGRPGTLKVMQDHFAGQPVNKQNLSDWRQGGFLEWQRQQEALDFAGRLLEDAEDAEKLAQDGPLADRMAELVALSLGHLLQAAIRQPDGPEKTKAVLKSARELIRPRRSDRENERADREQKDWQRNERDRGEQDREKAERERKDRLLVPILVAERRRALLREYEISGHATDAARTIAWFKAGVEFGLPESECTPPPKPGKAPTTAMAVPSKARRAPAARPRSLAKKKKLAQSSRKRAYRAARSGASSMGSAKEAVTLPSPDQPSSPKNNSPAEVKSGQPPSTPVKASQASSPPRCRSSGANTPSNPHQIDRAPFFAESAAAFAPSASPNPNFLFIFCVICASLRPILHCPNINVHSCPFVVQIRFQPSPFRLTPDSASFCLSPRGAA